MKKTLFLFSILLSHFSTFSQVQFKTFNSFEDLLQQAQKEKKLIFIQIENDNCAQCNEVALKGLSSSQLTEKYEANFISTKIAENGDLGSNLKQRYGNDKRGGSLFLDSEGNFILNFNQTTSNSLTYLNWADKAIDFSKKKSEIDELQKEYQNGNRSVEFLEKYLLTARRFDRPSDAILEELVRKLTIDSLITTKYIDLILQQALPLNSFAYRSVWSLNSKAKIDSVWNNYPKSQARQINDLTVSKTLGNAIKSKNTHLARQLSNFIQNINHSNYRNASFLSRSMLCNYFKNIKDTANYLKEANAFAQFEMLPISNDSLKKWDSDERDVIFNEKSKDDVRRFILISNRYATELNNIAFGFYEMTRDTMYLKRALKWSEKALDISENVAPTQNSKAAFMDTYAHLLYKLKLYDEAIGKQKEAIEAQKLTGMVSKRFEDELDKMITRKL